MIILYHPISSHRIAMLLQMVDWILLTLYHYMKIDGKKASVSMNYRLRCVNSHILLHLVIAGHPGRPRRPGQDDAEVSPMDAPHNSSRDIYKHYTEYVSDLLV